jgi:pimeloyl-ACP methyl ester carboxylesterase
LNNRAKVSRQSRFHRDGFSLACHDYGGVDNAILLLHGLCGGSHEWAEVVESLAASSRIIALDQRGHAFSDKPIGDYSRDAFVNDVVNVIEAMQLVPVILVGQSMGGLNALLVAARRPDLVRGLVLIEASPAQNAEGVEKVRAWFRTWPESFPNRDEAIAFFGGDTVAAGTWVNGLEETDAGLVPRFRRQDMIDSMADIATRSYWDEWRTIMCPSLLIIGDGGSVPVSVIEEMMRLKPELSIARVSKAGHDVHLNQSASVAGALDAFFAEVDKVQRRE